MLYCKDLYLSNLRYDYCSFMKYMLHVFNVQVFYILNCNQCMNLFFFFLNHNHKSFLVFKIAPCNI